MHFLQNYEKSINANHTIFLIFIVMNNKIELALLIYHKILFNNTISTDKNDIMVHLFLFQISFLEKEKSFSSVSFAAKSES